MSQTLRLRKLQEPTHLSRLLDALILRAELVPPDAYQIRSADSVPSELRNIAKLAVHSGRVWSCWGHGVRVWLFTAEMPLDLSRERHRPMVRVDVYGDDGLSGSSLWTTDRDGKWQRCAD